MRLLAAATAGLAALSLVSILSAETNKYRQRLQHFRCWLCKRPTPYAPSARVKHCDCGYCGIGNKLTPGALTGALPDITVALL